MSVMAFRSVKERKRVTLSITPLIDVLFLLIIFFMLTGTFKRAGELELHLPDSSTATPAGSQDEAHQVELIITEDGVLTLDADPVELPQLKGRLLATLKEDPESRVMIKAESGVKHGEVVLLLDIVRDVGFPGVGIGTHLKAAGGID